MTPDVIVDILRTGLWTTIILVASVVVPGLCIGLMVAMFQAATQINEMSLTFIPKLIGTLLIFIYAAPWFVNMMVEYTQNLYRSIPGLIG
jgi:flagellar biosynthesis protein FliQ